MKNSLKTLIVALSAIPMACGLAACGGDGGTEINTVKDPNPYTFTNSGHAIAECDDYMTIDGEFTESRYEKVRWLEATDKPNSDQSADIRFVCFSGEKGLYFGIDVIEQGTNIWVNPSRTSWVNSTLEMYMGPVGVVQGTYKTFEFDFQADGSIGSTRTNSPTGWRDAKTTWDKMPVIAAIPLGGAINTEDCYGYQIEAFFPFEYLEFAGWDVSDPDSLTVGIDPVHIFSLNYTGIDVSANETNDRTWSRWASKYLSSIGWLDPDTYFHFGKDGLLGYDYYVTYGGEGKGTVTETGGLPCILAQANATFLISPRNGASVTKLTVNGVDYLKKLRYDGGSYTFVVENPTADLDIQIEFN